MSGETPAKGIDEAALLAAFRRLETPLFNVLYRWLWDAQDCQDLIHDAFLRLWSRRASVDPARIDALVYATALNLARNRLRWRRLWRFVVEDPDAESGADGPELDAERAQQQQRVRHALEKLDPAARNVLLLSAFAGMDTAEIAAVLNVAPGTVGSRKHRALAALRGTLGGTTNE